MIPTLTLLPLSLALVASPITIADVTATRDGARLVIDISAEAMVDPEMASAKVDDGRIYLFIADTRVKSDNRAWGEGESQIRAHRHKHEVELVVPQGEPGEDVCQGPVEFVKASSGLRAFVGCGGTFGAGKSARQPARVARPSTKTAATTDFSRPILTAGLGATMEPPPAAGKADPARDSRALKEMLALNDKPLVDDDERPAMKAIAAAPLVAAAAPPKAKLEAAAPVAGPPAPAERSAPAAAAPLLAIGAPPAVPPETSAAKADEAAPDSARAGGPSGGVGVYLAGVLLLALAGGAYFFARKRAVLPRLVRIIETASLGPKRSIVVAQIGGQTVILGSSEAGITVLQSRGDANGPLPSPVAPSAAMAAGTSMLASALAGHSPVASELVHLRGLPSDEPAGNIPEPDFAEDSLGTAQGGLLARLFRRGRPANESASDNFEVLLEDSVEDQELRHKLSLGMAGRVP